MSVESILIGSSVGSMSGQFASCVTVTLKFSLDVTLSKQLNL
jgi:hypothetical protein